MGDTLSKITVPLEVVLGATSSTVEQIAAFGPGTIIELDALAGEPVSLRAAGKEIATGEVVVIDESFGIRITGLTGVEPRTAGE